jgi:hypothetical protein
LQFLQGLQFHGYAPFTCRRLNRKASPCHSSTVGAGAGAPSTMDGSNLRAGISD